MKAKEIEHLSEMYVHYHGRCFLCGKIANQRAHLIGNTKANRKRYGGMIDNPLNWLPACSLGCNALMDLGKNTHILDHVAQAIGEGDRDVVEDIVLENVARKRSKL